MIDDNTPFVCTGCGTNQRLSRSHIIPRSRTSDKTRTPEEIKENLTWHCLSVGDIVGCHQKHEGMRVVELNDFEANMLLVHKNDPSYFWLRMYKLMGHYSNNEEVKTKLRKIVNQVE